MALDGAAYAHLLGHYLGDGHITAQRGSSWALSVACSDAWPGVMAEVADSLRVVLSSATWFVQRSGCTEVKARHAHLPCLFPQHGPGRKHERPIVLEPWQQEVVDQYAGLPLRGLFHSDGWRGHNVAVHRRKGEVVRYRYPRYEFTNKSEDIRRICAESLDRLGIAWRRTAGGASASTAVRPWRPWTCTSAPSTDRPRVSGGCRRRSPRR